MLILKYTLLNLYRCQKLKWFAKHMGCEERFFYPNELEQYDKIYKTFLDAIENGNSKLNTTSLKTKTYTELEQFLTSQVENVNIAEPPQTLVAVERENNSSI